MNKIIGSIFGSCTKSKYSLDFYYINLIKGQSPRKNS